jgi:iron(III) transport system ATP-binding protein
VVVETLLGQIGLPGHGTRYPHTLSGGQQQRVAVARALAPEPDVLLMDEPFASIDISLRRKLREETRRLVKARESVTLLVTHDPEEALEIADRIAVLEDGQITQVGTARELHDAPASLFVGLMAGSGAVVRGTVSDGGCETPFGRFAAQDIDAKDGTHGREVDILIHPHRASLMADVEGLFISDLRETGRSQIVTLRRADGDTLLVEVGLTPGWAVGDRVSLKPEGGAWPAFAV